MYEVDNLPENQSQPPVVSPVLISPNVTELKGRKWVPFVVVVLALIGIYFSLARHQSWWPFKAVDEFHLLDQVILPNEVAYWQTYQNEQYGFEFKYPHDWNWTVNDQTYTYLNKSYKSVVIASPQNIAGVPGASREAYFYIHIFKDGQDWKHEEGMNLSHRASDGGPVPVSVSKQYLENTEEFKMSKLVWDSFKFTK